MSRWCPKCGSLLEKSEVRLGKCFPSCLAKLQAKWKEGPK